MDKWDRRFMEMAHLVSSWTSCYTEGRAIGAVIVKDKRVLCTGYNGAPAGLKTCKERGECMRRRLGVQSGTHAELCFAIHAEERHHPGRQAGPVHRRRHPVLHPSALLHVHPHHH